MNTVIRVAVDRRLDRRVGLAEPFLLTTRSSAIPRPARRPARTAREADCRRNHAPCTPSRAYRPCLRIGTSLDGLDGPSKVFGVILDPGGNAGAGEHCVPCGEIGLLLQQVEQIGASRRVGCVSGQRTQRSSAMTSSGLMSMGPLRRLSDGAIIARLLVADERPALQAWAERHDGRLVALVGGRGTGAQRPGQAALRHERGRRHSALKARWPSRTVSGACSSNRVSALRLSASRRMASPDQHIASP